MAYTFPELCIQARNIHVCQFHKLVWHILDLIFFSMNKYKRCMPPGTFCSYWDSRKKPKGKLKNIFFLKKPGVIKNIFFKKILEFLGLFLYPWKLLAKENFTPGNSTFFLDHPQTSEYFTYTCYFFNTPGNLMLSTSVFFPGITHFTLFRLLFFKVL